MCIFTFQLGKKIGYEGAAILVTMVVGIPMTMMFHEPEKEAGVGGKVTAARDGGKESTCIRRRV